MNLSWLPPLYREIAEHAGLEPTLGLARAKGGQRVYVPLDARIAPWLVQAMGEDGAAALVKMFGGEAIDLPGDPSAGQKARVRRIRQMIAQGESANAVAAAVGSSRRHIFWHKAQMRERDLDRQPDLFTPTKGR
jgi:hypothetical protein